MASSKLLDDVELISVTLATDIRPPSALAGSGTPLGHCLDPPMYFRLEAEATDNA
jgi:hypothetical protein